MRSCSRRTFPYPGRTRAHRRTSSNEENSSPAARKMSRRLSPRREADCGRMEPVTTLPRLRPFHCSEAWAAASMGTDAGSRASIRVCRGECSTERATVPAPAFPVAPVRPSSLLSVGPPGRSVHEAAAAAATTRRAAAIHVLRARTGAEDEAFVFPVFSESAPESESDFVMLLSAWARCRRLFSAAAGVGAPSTVGCEADARVGEDAPGPDTASSPAATCSRFGLCSGSLAHIRSSMAFSRPGRDGEGLRILPCSTFLNRRGTEGASKGLKPHRTSHMITPRAYTSDAVDALSPLRSSGAM